MNSDRNKYLIEVIGILVVVASLIFVGMQLLLDRKVALAEQYYNRSESQRADLRAQLESEAYFNNSEAMWSLGTRPPWWDENHQIAELVNQEKLSVRDLYFQITRSTMALVGMDNLYFQYQQRLLPNEFWETQRQIIKNRLVNDGIPAQLYLFTQRPIREVILQIVSEIEAEESIDGTKQTNQ